MISEGSCETEDLCNDAENSAFHHHLKVIDDCTGLMYFLLNKCILGVSIRVF